MNSCTCGKGLGSLFWPIPEIQNSFNNISSFFNSLENKIDNSLYGSLYDAYGRSSISGYSGKLNLEKAKTPPPPAPSLLSDLQGGWNVDKLDTMRKSQLNTHWTSFNRDPVIDETKPITIEGSNYLWAGLGVIAAIVLIGRK